MSGKAVLKSNCLILFCELQKAVDNYLKYGHLRGEIQYIDAFLTATIHSFIDYADGHLDPDKKDDEFNACRYANNILKHNPALVTHKKTIGGFHFPLEFSASEPIVFPKIQVIWNYDKALTVQSKIQQSAFQTLFAEKPVIDTLQPLVNKIELS